MDAYLNRVATAVPPNDVHAAFVGFAAGLIAGERSAPVFDRLVKRSQIEHRWSVLTLADGGRSAVAGNAEVYRRGAFPSTGQRMRLYERFALDLAAEAVEGLDLGERAREVTHLIAVSCTGFYAPGLDLQLVARCGLDPSVERTVVGFMGCYAGINALKLARHIVRSEPRARVLIVSVELCTLHLQETSDLEKVLSFLVFGDGCAAALVTADPAGLSLDRFHAALLPEASEQITWTIGDGGFDMFLSGQVPASVGEALRRGREVILDGAGTDEIDLWAIHPGGRSVLDAVQGALELGPEALADSREVLRLYGNMSSATVLFVLARMLGRARSGERGCAMAFGPGLTAETLLFSAA
ncbi:type III polyketide synthase [Rubellimicrobium aerolatum]|uniref:Type III polyketide synthase n=1 Tax=Rubellimicrobium aerolatum TaxID=490979 RepID=A0ABW0SGQ8_9RHOB|nr:type III polyketide synthase [Rubellimicrobium aerolatum]MBP1807536.1 putative naringenin-chalcone synthase [Rubellimicrobium aerolatum]